MSEVRLGIDIACRADHRASLADERGEFIWSSWKFWPSPVLTDIHDRAAKSRKDVQNGDYGREEEATTAVVFR
jgi:hypothetical protein